MARRSSIAQTLLLGVGAVLVLLLALEATSWWLAEGRLRDRGFFYDPEYLASRIDDASFAEYLEVRDPVTGWPAPSSFGDPSVGHYRDRSGARFSPAFPEPGNACVSLYGGSFVWAEDVDDEAAWGNQLAKRLGCRVANYGVGAYGADQSLLRFRENETDGAPVAILAYMTSNIERILSRWLVFQYSPVNYTVWRQMKPRFVLDEDGQLELVPLPELSYDDLRASLARPADALPHDYYAPDGPAAPLVHTPSFPYLRTLFVLAGAALDGPGRENHVALYDPEHPSDAYRITREILRGFATSAKARGVQPVILFIPSRREIREFGETGEWLSGPLAQDVAAAGVPVRNVLEPMIERVGQDTICDYYTPGHCRTHLDARGNALLADVVFEELQALREAGALEWSGEGGAGAAR